MSGDDTGTPPPPSPREPSFWPAIRRLPPTTRRQLIERIAAELGPLRLRYAPFPPEPKQEAFLRLECVEAFFGGAAGPGKSTALLMAAAQYVDVPGYAALLLRRLYTDLALPGALMDMAAEWWGATDAVWVAGERSWRFPSGATITFGHLQHDEAKRRYASAEFQFIGFDELTHFTQTQYEFLFSRLRRPARAAGAKASPDGMTLADVPLRVRSASNPGGPGHAWVKARFVDAKTRASGVRFLPALLSDNPHLDQDSYLQSLARLGAIERERLRAGDWTVAEQGASFRRDWLEARITHEPGRLTRLVRYWDLAGTEESPTSPDPDYTVGLLLGCDDRTGEWVILDVQRGRWTPAKVRRRVQATAARDGLDVPVVIEQEGGQAGKDQVESYQRLLLGYQVHGDKPTGDKVTRAETPSAAAENGLLWILAAAWNADLIDELELFPYAGHDDHVDALSGGMRWLVRGGSYDSTLSLPTGQLPEPGPDDRFGIGSPLGRGGVYADQLYAAPSLPSGRLGR